MMAPVRAWRRGVPEWTLPVPGGRYVLDGGALCFDPATYDPWGEHGPQYDTENRHRVDCAGPVWDGAGGRVGEAREAAQILEGLAELSRLAPLI